MNAKAEKFKQYLAGRGIPDEAFDVEELEDELHTVLFRSQIEVEGDNLPIVIVLDDSMYGIVRVRVAANALRAGHELELLQKINDINKRFKLFKYYVYEDNALMLDCVLVNSGANLDCDAAYTVVDVLMRHITDDYKELMKAIWA